jgi:F-type H+-transporting ATPase subunit delta
LSASALTKRYAKAFLEIGTEKGQVEEFGTELMGLSVVLSENEALKQLLESPTFVYEKKAAILKDIAEKAGMTDDGKKFVGLLLQKGRLNYLSQISADYSKLADELSGKMKAKITSAIELTDTQSGQIKKDLEKLTGKTIELETAVDATLIGGVKAEFAGTVYDGSLKTQLDKISDTLQKG